MTRRWCEHPAQPCEVSSGTPAREYRRGRQHLYPLEEYEAALVEGDTVRSFCGLDRALSPDDPADVQEATTPQADDCETCIDVWRERRLIRL